jgi:hypothetical protein
MRVSRKKPASTLDLAVYGEPVALAQAERLPGCFGEYEDCSGAYCLQFKEPCREMVDRGGKILAVIRYLGDHDAGSYPAVILKFLMDHRHEFVVLQDVTISAIRETFNYYGVEADQDDAGRYRLQGVKGQENVRYEVDQQHGLLIVRTGG